MRPVIGITPSPQRDELPHGAFVRYAMSSSYVDAILAAGGLPVILPPQEGGADELFDRLDGLLLSGGADIDPAVYGDPAIHPMTYGIDPLRDRFEFALLDEALARDTPVFCICRGIQVLNVKLGGTLIQDVPDQYETSTIHQQHHAGIAKDQIGHRVTPAADGEIARLYGTEPIGVNSFHHQAIKDLGAGLAVAAIAEDGLVEAISLPDRSFVLGVQWHPEMMFEHHPEQLEPFKALVEAAHVRRLAGSHR